MSRISRSVLLALWVLTLVVAAQWGAKAQQNNQNLVLSGSDIGFRMQGKNKNGKAFGTFVVKLNGQWVEVGSDGGKLVPARQ